ncbi:MAG: Rnase Y domain-containing protein, partial [Firmicutes bacterium]|nr:Rnase Y domain-containing protein [Bacillota bacterium]
MLTLAMLASSAPAIISGVVAGVLGLAIGFVVRQVLYVNKKNAADKTAARVISEAYQEAKVVKQNAVIEAKEEALKLTKDSQEEFHNKRLDLERQQDRINLEKQQMESQKAAIAKDEERSEKTKQDLASEKESLARQKDEVEKAKNEALDKLTKVAKLSKEEAKKEVISLIEGEAKKEAAIIVKDIERKAKEDSTKVAKEIISHSIQRMAGEYTAEITTSTVTIPSDEVKGRIIGREGRNIR